MKKVLTQQMMTDNMIHSAPLIVVGTSSSSPSQIGLSEAMFRRCLNHGVSIAELRGAIITANKLLEGGDVSGVATLRGSVSLVAKSDTSLVTSQCYSTSSNLLI